MHPLPCPSSVLRIAPPERYSARPARPRGGFTLVELLVVVAILALLAGMLFPVLARAREQAHRAQCTSNLQQIARAFAVYAEDYDDRLPSDAAADVYSLEAVRKIWFWKIVPYLKSTGVFHCPADPIRTAQRAFLDALPEYWDGPDVPALSYGANWNLLWQSEMGNPMVARGALLYPSETLLVSDCTEPWAFGPVYIDPAGVRWSHMAYANGPPLNGFRDEPRHGGRSGMGHERHGTGSLIAYVDGHVAFMPALRFYSVTVFVPRGFIWVQRPVISEKAVPPEAVRLEDFPPKTVRVN
jgi:prepilin-type N-terminal cleavage/methylation domain-containing protein/prepilin-type processing-associated H-X9-DG protein